MQEGDLVKIDLLVAHSGNSKSKAAWGRIKKDFEELAQQPHNTRIVQILKEAKENELKILPWECMTGTVKRYQDILNELYELVVQNQHNA